MLKTCFAMMVEYCASRHFAGQSMSSVDSIVNMKFCYNVRPEEANSPDGDHCMKCFNDMLSLLPFRVCPCS